MPARQSNKGNSRTKLSIRRGDEVVVTAGKDRGKRGTVTRVLPEENRIIVDGVNMVKRHLRRQPGSLQAGIVDMPAPLSRANVMIVCPSCDHASRIGRTQLPDGTRARVCKHCSEILDKER